VPCTGDDAVVFGAVYALDAREKAVLDAFEGCGAGYIDAPVSARVGEARHDCFTYFAQPGYVDDALRPYHWYRELVLAGADYLDLPAWYRRRIMDVASVPDPDAARRREHESLLRRMARQQPPRAPATNPEPRR
jgi:hypothetical protein